MAISDNDPKRAERIESFRAWFARTYLDAAVIKNNDLSDALLKTGAFCALKRFIPRNDAKETRKRLVWNDS